MKDVVLPTVHPAIEKIKRSLIGELVVALLDLAHEGNCWCGKGIGDPRLRDHTPVCKRTKLLVDDVEKLVGTETITWVKGRK